MYRVMCRPKKLGLDPNSYGMPLKAFRQGWKITVGQQWTKREINCEDGAGDDGIKHSNQCSSGNVEDNL